MLPTTSGLPARAARQRASDILDLVGLDEARFRPIGGFSTGMRQRAQEYEDNPDLVRGIIAEGCEKAREVAGQTIDDVKQAMGLAYR